jgi:ABC-2 type transport system permease protein
MRGNFDYTGKLVRFMLRRERVIAAIWIIVIALFSIALVPGLDTMFPDNETRENISLMYDNPIMISMMGPIYEADGVYTTGTIYTGMMLLWVMMSVAIMNIFIIIRHTRADEERWRAEVIRSLPVGRLATVHAAMLTALIINAILALVTGLGLAAVGTAEMNMNFAGGMLYGAVLGASGLVFAAVTAIFCQLSASSSGAYGLSFLVLGGSYMLRAAGDVGNEILSLISPLGLAQRTKIYAENDLLPLFALIAAAIVLAAIAYKLNSVRDLGQGIIPARPGRYRAKKSLLSSFGLSLRLLKNAIIVWVITMFLLGASYGSIIGEIDRFVGDSPEYLTLVGIPPDILETLSESDKADMIVDGFGGFVTTMMTLIALVPLLMFAMKPKAEEIDGRAEGVLSRSVSRGKYLAGYVIITFIMSILVQLCSALGLYGAAQSTVTEGVAGETAAVLNPFVLEKLLAANFAYLPAMWLIIGFTVLVVGFFPRAGGVVWGYYGFTCFMALIGNIPDLLPAWVSNLTPFNFIPEIRVTNFDLFPAAENSFAPLAAMTTAAIALTVIGFIGYRKRDLITH